jgi:hypothetical protein
MESAVTSGRRSGRILRTVGAGAMAFSLLLMFASPAFALTISPKYHGGISYWIHPEAQSCASYHFPQKWSFNFATGKTIVNANAHAKTCPNAVPGVNDRSFGCACAQNTLGINLKVPFKGATSVGVNWSAAFRVAGTTSLNNASCPTTFHHYSDPSNGSYSYNYTSGDCYAAASVFFGANSWVYDLTNGTYVNGPGIWGSGSWVAGSETYIFWGDFGPGYSGTGTSVNFSYNSTYTTGTTSFSNNVSSAGTTWFNSTYLHSHKYVFEVFFYGNPIAQAGGASKSSASALLDAASPGHGLSINYISVS